METPNPFPFLPFEVGAVTVTDFDGFSYVDANGRTYWSGVAEPSEADAFDCVTNPRTPPVPVPELITRPQFFVAARRVLGLSEDDLTALIDLLPAGEHRETARDFLRNSQTFRRAHPALVDLATLKGLTAAQLDDFFRYASSIE
ncbi:MAG: hypothetical protein Q8M02_14645 [Candidatus Didemnitutus sp.]|nr:hypothetical protein [Candidatus Didemnitutus sp.]